MHRAKPQHFRDVPRATQYLSKETPKQHSPTCGNWGLIQHTKTDTCPAKSLRCSSCQKIGHWPTRCRSSARLKTARHPRDHQKSHQVHAVEANSDAGEYTLYTLSINSLSSSTDAVMDLTFSTTDCLRKLRCKIDTGAETNNLPLHTTRTKIRDMDTA